VTASGGGGTTTQLWAIPGFKTVDHARSVDRDHRRHQQFNSEPPHAGSWDAWLDGYGTTHTGQGDAAVTIPAAQPRQRCPSSCTLTALKPAHNRVRQIDRTGAQFFWYCAFDAGHFSNLNQATATRRRHLTLLSFKGQTIQIFFSGVEDSTLQLHSCWTT